MKNSYAYLSRLSKPKRNKLYPIIFFPEGSKRVVDVGCADGSITKEYAARKPLCKFLGIDLRPEFISLAQQHSSLKNTRYLAIYLRDLLKHFNREIDVVLFLSVLHEFFNYGEGISSVTKALCDAHELLRSGGRIIIRDMFLPESLKQSTQNLSDMMHAIRTSEWVHTLYEFEHFYGPVGNIYDLNHFLLKYFYVDNWSTELPENYTGVSLEKAKDIAQLLDMTIQVEQCYLLAYLRSKWIDDFGFKPHWIMPLRSTTVLVLEKK